MALVSVVVPYSSVPQMYMALYPRNRQKRAKTSALKTPLTNKKKLNNFENAKRRKWNLEIETMITYSRWCCRDAERCWRRATRSWWGRCVSLGLVASEPSDFGLPLAWIGFFLPPANLKNEVWASSSSGFAFCSCQCFRKESMGADGGAGDWLLTNEGSFRGRLSSHRRLESSASGARIERLRIDKVIVKINVAIGDWVCIGNLLFPQDSYIGN